MCSLHSRNELIDEHHWDEVTVWWVTKNDDPCLVQEYSCMLMNKFKKILHGLCVDFKICLQWERVPPLLWNMYSSPQKSLWPGTWEPMCFSSTVLERERKHCANLLDLAMFCTILSNTCMPTMLAQFGQALLFFFFLIDCISSCYLCESTKYSVYPVTTSYMPLIRRKKKELLFTSILTHVLAIHAVIMFFFFLIF